MTEQRTSDPKLRVGPESASWCSEHGVIWDDRCDVCALARQPSRDNLLAEIARLTAERNRLREALELAKEYVYANQGGWCRDGIRCDAVLGVARNALARADEAANSTRTCCICGCQYTPSDTRCDCGEPV